MSKLKIGDKLYRYVSPSGIWEYVIIGIREYKDSVMYEAEAQASSHGYKCVLLIAEDEKGAYKYVSLLNYDEDDDQSYWHNDKKFCTFWTNKYLAHKECYKSLLADEKAEIHKLENQLKEKKDSVAKLEKALELAISQADELLKVWGKP